MEDRRTKTARIAHILGSADRGGTETNVHDLVSSMASDFVNELFFLSERGSIGESLEQKGFRVYYFPLSGPRSISVVILQLYRLLRSSRYHIIHLYGLKANFIGRVLGKLSRHEIILGALRSMYPSGRKKNCTLWMDRLTFGLSLGYVSNSQAAIDFLAAHGYDRRKFWLIHNGIDITQFYERSEKEKRTIKQEYDLPLDKPIITCVANLRHPKGHEYLIQALHELNNENFLTLLVGDGSLRDELEEQVRQLGIKPRVRFMGSRDREDIPRILAITDIFVLPSLWEGLPTAVIEAMAAGCPVVATAVGGTGELIIDGKTGFLVSSQDEKALAEKMELLLRDYELREKMGQAGAKRAKEQFSIDRMVREYEALYRKLISG